MVTEAKDIEALRQAIIAQVVKRRGPDMRIIGGDERSQVDWLTDFRALLLQPEWLDRYAELFWERFADQYPFQVCGMETSAISLVAAIVMKSIAKGLPVNGLYCRKSRKRQGMLKQLEGTPNRHHVILVDDLIHSGSTFDKQIKILSDVGLQVSGTFSLLTFRDIATYHFPLAPAARIKHVFSLPDIGLPLEVGKPEDDPEKFDVVWKFEAPGALYNVVSEKSGLACDERCLYFGTDSGTFYALNKSDGSIRWRFTIERGGEGNAIFSTPALHKGMLYFGASDGAVHALDAANGSKRWSYADADWVRSSPCIDSRREILYIGLSHGLLRKEGNVVALDIHTGRAKWSSNIRGTIEGAPLFVPAEDLVIIGDTEGIVHALDAATGVLRWRFGSDGAIHASFAYDSLRRLICFGSAKGTLYALFAPDGSPVFGISSMGWIRSTPLIVDRTLYVSSLDKKLYSINLDTGTEMWNFATKGRVFASPALIGDSIWLGSNDGRLYEIDAKTGRQKGYFQASERIVNKPIFDEKASQYFVPTQANQLYCLKRKSG